MTPWPPCDVQRIEHAVESVERTTSAELRVHIARTCEGDPRDRATRIFASLGMHRTAARNGVLIYVAPMSRKWAVLGDVGINAHVPPAFWHELAHDAVAHFQEEQFTEGIVELVKRCGETLAASFPREAGDINELPDHVSVE